ncbi:DUF4446 family protein [Paenibacillus urinalis]|uniref:DUF4446 family protein n=1 Tax=Paenibacillus urinalis TaxID=521520 RepID=A0AAX3MZH9_9BACL|nr:MULTISPECIES: DUF4446 family protein [Paenibacillus]WDH82697.1 DUF4446 family protein [Paenibacillus urinalis]WDH98747.1 DUF4446 family protein [Paenibacillus urinalis]WDI02441.1 DUF4446 family protein [Paenibacillus urinalis]GAK41469.1 hypothetical protein TCA2_3960 [Paenibacillus sp. TCA20]
MTDMNELILEQLPLIVFGIVLVLIILLIMLIVQTAKVSKLRKNYNKFMSSTGVEDLESLLLNLKVQMDAIEDEQAVNKDMVATMNKKLDRIQGKMGIKRYNAYGDRGADLSFSIAMLNEREDGLVLTGLYNRDGSYVYAKPLQGGESTYTLSNEEKEAITLARQAE